MRGLVQSVSGVLSADKTVTKSKKIHPSLAIDSAPSDVFMNFDAFQSNTETRLHSHHWGQLQVINGGTLELNAEGMRFIAPPHLAIWLPAGVQHYSYNRKPLNYCSININAAKTQSMPPYTCLVSVTPIVSAIIDDFRKRSVTVAESIPDQRLANVLLDQLAISQEQQHFLPTTSHKALLPILLALEDDPTDDTPLSEWASRVHTTERTLARYCHNELGMSFTEWRIRARYLHSMTLLKKGLSVKEVALTLRYKQASPFIAMFKKYAGETPEQYKNRIL
ncbi:AraC family transcriptional regulator [Vibrio sp. HA2012]|uniref:AraC family transcriptional regulator n=1 Tax=Vibrio sp. HA2012 TaxID=1971595 RepID=UPI000C2B8B8B|nr:helix-turn-helix transcriptional regulator [Vibrio sp. HA2012]PJC87521.1 AraC family transcriptional regulator [Vibrio sp. HA2012]